MEAVDPNQVGGLGWQGTVQLAVGTGLVAGTQALFVLTVRPLMK